MPVDCSPVVSSRVMMQEHGGIKVGDRVFFNFSLTVPKYNVGTVKEIYEQPNGKIIFTIWDEDRCMWRNFTIDRVFTSKPLPEKKDK